MVTNQSQFYKHGFSYKTQHQVLDFLVKKTKKGTICHFLHLYRLFLRFFFGCTSLYSTVVTGLWKSTSMTQQNLGNPECFSSGRRTDRKLWMKRNTTAGLFVTGEHGWTCLKCVAFLLLCCKVLPFFYNYLFIFTSYTWFALRQIPQMQTYTIDRLKTDATICVWNLLWSLKKFGLAFRLNLDEKGLIQE